MRSEGFMRLSKTSGLCFVWWRSLVCCVCMSSPLLSLFKCLQCVWDGGTHAVLLPHVLLPPPASRTPPPLPPPHHTTVSLPLPLLLFVQILQLLLLQPASLSHPPRFFFSRSPSSSFLHHLLYCLFSHLLLFHMSCNFSKLLNPTFSLMLMWTVLCFEVFCLYVLANQKRLSITLMLLLHHHRSILIFFLLNHRNMSMKFNLEQTARLWLVDCFYKQGQAVDFNWSHFLHQSSFCSDCPFLLSCCISSAGSEAADVLRRASSDGRNAEKTLPPPRVKCWTELITESFWRNWNFALFLLATDGFSWTTNWLCRCCLSEHLRYSP